MEVENSCANCVYYRWYEDYDTDFDIYEEFEGCGLGHEDASYSAPACEDFVPSVLRR